jgi:hypothetical protein
LSGYERGNMGKRGRFGMASVALVALAILCKTLAADNSSAVRFDLGRNILETASDSGVPKFSTRNIAGLVSYSVDSLPSNLPVVYTRPGFETSLTSIFALTLYSDEENHNNLAVTDAVLQFSTDALRDHAAGQLFVDSLNAKFAARKWSRHIPELCPAVTGRSSFLRPDGTVGVFEGCPLDPKFRVYPEEWRSLATLGLSYEWIGDGVIASIKVNSSEGVRGITYYISIDFENEKIRTKHRAKTLARDLSNGDKQGWNSSKKYAADMVVLREEIQTIELSAVKRGDQVVSRERK